MECLVSVYLIEVTAQCIMHCAVLFRASNNLSALPGASCFYEGYPNSFREDIYTLEDLGGERIFDSILI